MLLIFRAGALLPCATVASTYFLGSYFFEQVLFYNVRPDGNTDVDALHAAMPVSDGEKWVANLWVWDPTRGRLH